jgi:hypothetical protein
MLGTNGHRSITLDSFGRLPPIRLIAIFPLWVSFELHPTMRQGKWFTPISNIQIIQSFPCLKKNMRTNKGESHVYIEQINLCMEKGKNYHVLDANSAHIQFEHMIVYAPQNLLHSSWINDHLFLMDNLL